MSNLQGTVKPGTLLCERQPTRISNQRRLNFKAMEYRFSFETTRSRTRFTFQIPTDFCWKSPPTTSRKRGRGGSQTRWNCKTAAASGAGDQFVHHPDAVDEFLHHVHAEEGI